VRGRTAERRQPQARELAREVAQAGVGHARMLPALPAPERRDL
jgi:hypothetical protein